MTWRLSAVALAAALALASQPARAYSLDFGLTGGVAGCTATGACTCPAAAQMTCAGTTCTLFGDVTCDTGTVGDINVRNGVTLKVTPWTSAATTQGILNLRAPHGTLTLEAGAIIDANQSGYSGSLGSVGTTCSTSPGVNGNGFGPGFGPEGRGRGRGHGRRAGRGDIRAAILLLLAEQPRHGYELIKEIGERTDGAWVPSPGAIYPALALLEDEGLVTVEAESGRKLAALSDAGRAYVTAHADELGDPFADATARTPKSRWALRDSVRGLMGASMQVAQNGDEAQVASALVVLDAAKKDLYRILAGDQPATGAASSDEAPEA